MEYICDTVELYLPSYSRCPHFSANFSSSVDNELNILPNLIIWYVTHPQNWLWNVLCLGHEAVGNTFLYGVYSHESFCCVLCVVSNSVSISVLVHSVSLWMGFCLQT